MKNMQSCVYIIKIILIMATLLKFYCECSHLALRTGMVLSLQNIKEWLQVSANELFYIVVKQVNFLSKYLRIWQGFNSQFHSDFSILR